MPRFFLPDVGREHAIIFGDDARHIAKSLRMREGETLVLCDMKGHDYDCVIESLSMDAVQVRIVEKRPSVGEPACKVRLYQALPKGDKMEFIVQKATELGVHEIVPVVTDRCISRPNSRSMEKKRERLQKICFEAAKQSRRGAIPTVMELQTFNEAVQGMKELDLGILFYEESTMPLREIMDGCKPASMGIMVGCEGGFAGREAQMAEAEGIRLASLGPRILRCETAPVCALSAILYHLGDL